jgi:hypothetical protein
MAPMLRSSLTVRSTAFQAENRGSTPRRSTNPKIEENISMISREKEVTMGVAGLIREPRQDGGYHQMMEFGNFVVERIAARVRADGVVIPIDTGEYLARIVSQEIATSLLRLVRANQ